MHNFIWEDVPEKCLFDGDRSTAYLIRLYRIRCNNIHIRILLHLILEIRYARSQASGNMFRLMSSQFRL